jgi:hypothetical protein
MVPFMVMGMLLGKRLLVLEVQEAAQLDLHLPDFLKLLVGLPELALQLGKGLVLADNTVLKGPDLLPLLRDTLVQALVLCPRSLHLGRVHPGKKDKHQGQKQQEEGGSQKRLDHPLPQGEHFQGLSGFGKPYDLGAAQNGPPSCGLDFGNSLHLVRLPGHEELIASRLLFSSTIRRKSVEPN